MSPSQVFCGEPVRGTGGSWEESRAASRRRPLYGFSVYSRQWEERNHATHRKEHRRNGTPDARLDIVHCAPRVSPADTQLTCLEGWCPPASSPGRAAAAGARTLSPTVDISCRGGKVGLRTKTLHYIKSRSSQFCKMGLGLGDQGALSTAMRLFTEF